jgi:hypothetical protein
MDSRNSTTLTGAIEMIGLLLIASLLLFARCSPSDRLIAGPPAPTITEKPAQVTSSRSANFQYTVAAAGATFRCALDNAHASPCSADGISYAHLHDGPHVFTVNAEVQQLLSAPTSWSWLVTSSGSGSHTPGTTSTPGSGTQLVGGSSEAGDGQFTISGSAAGPLAPGVEQPIDLSFSNPLSVPLTVGSVTIAVDATTTKNGQTNVECAGAENLIVVHSLDAQPVLPANSTATLSALGVPREAWPLIAMPNLPVNQDACKNTRFALSYRATATSS